MLNEEQVAVQAAVAKMVELGLLPKIGFVDDVADNYDKVRELLRHLLPEMAAWAQAEGYRRLGAEVTGASKATP